MFCTKCGHPIPDGAPYCPNCGTRTGNPPSQPDAGQNTGKNYAPVPPAGQTPPPAENAWNAPAPAAAPASSRRFPIWGIILPVVIILLVGGVLLWSTLSNKENDQQASGSAGNTSQSSQAPQESESPAISSEGSSEQESSVEESSVEEVPAAGFSEASVESSEGTSESSAEASEESSAVESSEGTSESSAEASEESSAAESSAEESAAEGSAESSEESSEKSSEESSEPETPVRLKLISTDISDYPTVRLYVRIEYEDEEGAVSGVTTKEITLKERLSGGKYVAREVRKMEQLSGNQGLHIALVADKSDSISEEDMQKIKTVMSDFVDQLNFDVGDMAEVLAFDSIVQQMCAFTKEASLLKNGIDYMSTDGMTALYDAIHDGINHASLEGGARCVIAFTDGMDNESRYTPDDVIAYANEAQVPVYIIGVGGSVDEGILRTIAEDTGGHYWFIDDLFDLEQIYQEIYQEQMETYVLEYESESDADTESARDIEIEMSGGFIGKLEESFTPVISIIRKHHENRYEVVSGVCTWEEAAQACREKGGHLATITSQEEMDTLVDLCKAEDLTYIWIGGYTSYDDDDNVFGHWITGEEFSYEAWADGEPSRNDLDGTPEWYLMLWNIPSLGGWTWNDQRVDPAAVAPKMTDETMGYICEYEEQE